MSLPKTQSQPAVLIVILIFVPVVKRL